MASDGLLLKRDSKYCPGCEKRVPLDEIKYSAIYAWNETIHYWVCPNNHMVHKGGLIT